MNIIREARIAVLRDMTQKLDEFLSSKDYEPPSLYHLRGMDEDFCWECASQIDNDMAASGIAWEGQPYPHEAFEREDHTLCDRCYKLLDHSLSPVGAVEQINLFIDEDRSFIGALLPEEAFRVYTILMALHDLARFGTNDDIDEVWSGDYRNAVSLGEMALAAIIPDPEQLDLFTGGPNGQETDIDRSERGRRPTAGAG